MAQKGLSIFLAGMGVGVAAAMVVMDDGLRTRLGKGLRAGSQRVTDAVSDPQAAWDAVRNTVVDNGAQALNDATQELKSKINEAAGATRKMAEDAAGKSRDLAHRAGDQMERGAKVLQNV